MKQVLNKLKNKAGETLVETMAAILIFTFGSIIMLNMITSAVEINKMAEDADRQYLEDMKAVEMLDHKKPGDDHFVRIETDKDLLRNPFRPKIPVDVYGSENGTLYAYYQKGGSAT